ncbi:MAG: translation elongation factor Ts [Flavobacteriales bacterium]|nr:translation elongation factor Ts [Flavobacteriales bacterium]
MMSISASDVKKLRDITGGGMMDCKKALVEAEGDFDKAIDILRKKGQKVAAKRGDRDANEGLVIAKSNNSGNSGIIVTLNCETDFVAKNADFGDFANKIAEIALENQPNTVDELKSLSYDNGTSVQDKITEQVGKIGEKIDISYYGLINAETVVAYNHPGNQTASLVGLNKGDDATVDVGKDIAMQIAAMAPVALDESDVPDDIIQKELEIGKEQARAEGKPEDMLERIAQGKLKKFYKESTLLNQSFIKDNKMSVAQYLKSSNQDLQITTFKRNSLA